VLNRGGRGVHSPADWQVRDSEERQAETIHHAMTTEVLPQVIDFKRITADTGSRMSLTGLQSVGNTVTIPQTSYAKRLNATLSTTGEAFSEQASTQAILLSCRVHFPFRLLGQQPT
jgi:hypothetical protein